MCIKLLHDLTLSSDTALHKTAQSQLLPRDASAERGNATVKLSRPSVRPSVRLSVCL